MSVVTYDASVHDVLNEQNGINDQVWTGMAGMSIAACDRVKSTRQTGSDSRCD